MYIRGSGGTREQGPGISATMVGGDELLMDSRLRLRSSGVVIGKGEIQDTAPYHGEQPRDRDHEHQTRRMRQEDGRAGDMHMKEQAAKDIERWCGQGQEAS